MTGVSDLLETLGPPDIQLEDLRIWIHGRQFPGADDYWDGNWVYATAYCGSPGAEVWTSGPIIHLSEVVNWLADGETMRRTLSGEANLDCMEPELSVKLRTEGSLAHVSMRVEITPDNLKQEHVFLFEIDQTYLTGLIGACKRILTRFLVRGSS